MLKIITIVNWIAIAFLALLVGMETFFPTKGGDAAGRGMGQAIYFLAAIVLVVLLILNLIPHKYAKYAAFGIVLLPFAVMLLDKAWVNVRRLSDAFAPEGRNADGTPWFNDPQKQQLALAISRGEPDRVKKQLQEAPASILDRGDEAETLLEFAVSNAAHTSYREAEKVDCVKALFEAGARIEPADTTENPLHVSAVTVGDATLVKLLLEHGADPNVHDVHFKRPILFEAITSYKQPNETVQALLEAGADPNTEFVDVDSTATSALLHAAANMRWNICLQLIRNGADQTYRRTDGKTLVDLIAETNPYYSGDGYSTLADFEAVKKMVRH